MSRGNRLTRNTLRIIGAVAAALVLIVVVAVIALTNTAWGHAAVRQLVLRAARGPVHGIVRVGRIDGDLLSELVVSDVSISDSAGAPFLTAPRLELHYDLFDLVRKRLYFHGVRLDHAVIVLAESPDGIWNYKRIFRSSNSASDTTPRGWGSWIALSDLRLADADLTVQTPWRPDSTLRGAARDSAIRAALSPDARPAVTAVPGGFEKTVAVHTLTAIIPVLWLAEPDRPVKIAKVASLSADLAAFRPPDAIVRDLRGTFSFTTDSLWWQQATILLPASRLEGRGSYGLTSGNLELQLRAAQAALGDLRFLDPRLPDTGALAGDLSVRWRGQVQDYLVRHLVAHAGPAQAAGQLGITLGDSLALHDTDLRFAGIDTRLIEQLVPGFHAPRDGIASGRAALAGGLHALAVDANLTFDDRLAGRNRLTAVGQVGMGSGFRAHALRLTLAPLQTALASTAARPLPLAGTISGQVTIEGSTDSALSATADVVHRDGSAVSHMVATGDVTFAPAPPGPAPSDRPPAERVPVRPSGAREPTTTESSSGYRPSRVNIAASFDPIDLSALGKSAPAAKLHGRAAGSVRIRGDLHDLEIHSRLAIAGSPDSGVLAVDGHLDLASPVPRYDLTASSHVFDARAVSAAAPRTALTATASARGQGIQPATMTATVGADLGASVFDSTAVDTLHLRATIEQGQIRVTAAHLHALASTADLHGVLGVVAGRPGSLDYRVAVDSLQAFRRFLPLDTTTVAPRPARVAAAINQARADSARVAQSTEVERAIRNAPSPPLVVDTPPALRRDTLTGRAVATGSIRGDIDQFELRGDLVADSVIALGNAVRRARAQYRWVGGPRLTAPVALAVQLDTAAIAGFAFDRLDARATYRAPSGTLRLVVHQDAFREYTLNSAFRYTPTEKVVRYDTLALRFGNTVWRAPRPGSVQWGTNGIVFHQVELKSGARGRIAVDGFLPTHDGPPASVTATVQYVQLADLAKLAQSDLPFRGQLSATAKLTGSEANPHLSGRASISGAFAGTSPLPNLYLHVAYDTKVLGAHAELGPKGAPTTPFAAADVTVPINLAFHVTGPRLLDGPVRGDVRIDSLPLDVAPQFTSSVRDVGGRVTGHVTIGGTTNRLDLRGEVALNNGSVTIASTGTALRNVVARLHLTRDSLVIDSLVAQTPSTGGHLRVVGTYDRSDPTVPVLNVSAVASNARVLSTREHGRVDLDAKLTLAGPEVSPFLSGSATIRSAVLYVPESNGKRLVDLGDPAISHVADTADPRIRSILPATPLWLSRGHMDIDVSALRDCWVRTKDANVEAYTPEPITVRIDRARQALVVDGTVSTDRGEYAFMGKRFLLTKGTATFIGTPDLDPSIAATGEYDVPVPGRQALAILININGLLDSLRVSLTSNAEPPISQTDLLSYLAFSRPSNSLAQSPSSSLTGTGNSGSVVGTASAFVQSQLAAQALGVLTDQAKGDLARSLGADVLDITTGNPYTDIAQNRSATTFFQNTQIEFGKYFTPATYVALQASVAPGARVAHRLNENLIFQMSGEPLYLLGQPTLTTTPNTPLTGVFGFTLVRRWRF